MLETMRVGLATAWAFAPQIETGFPVRRREGGEYHAPKSVIEIPYAQNHCELCQPNVKIR